MKTCFLYKTKCGFQITYKYQLEIDDIYFIKVNICFCFLIFSFVLSVAVLMQWWMHTRRKHKAHIGVLMYSIVIKSTEFYRMDFSL